METSELDTVLELPAVYLVMKLSIDSFSGEDPTLEELDALGRELAHLWSGQMMTKKAIVSYKSALLNNKTLKAAQEMTKTSTING